MHKLIAIVIDNSDTAFEAEVRAKDIVDNVLQAERYGKFDWLMPCADERARWTNKTVRARDTKEKLHELFEHQLDDFKYHFEAVKKYIQEKPLNELSELHDFKYNCEAIGVDSSHWIFDKDGEQIQKFSDINLDSYVVFYDAHW